jgi:hypothetical protein
LHSGETEALDDLTGELRGSKGLVGAAKREARREGET